MYQKPTLEFQEFTGLPDPHCAVCGDTGWVLNANGNPDLRADDVGALKPSGGFCAACDIGMVAEAGYDMQRRDKATRFSVYMSARFEARVRQARIPPEYLEYPLRSWPVNNNPLRAKTLAAAQMFSDRRLPELPLALYIYGDKGTGKTALMCGTGMEALRLGESALFVNGGILLRNMRESFSRKDDKAAELIEEVTHTPLLLLDELGDLHRQTLVTDFTRTTIYELIEERKTHKRRTIITSNLDFEAFRAQFGEPTADRIRQMALLIGLKGASLRKPVDASFRA